MTLDPGLAVIADIHRQLLIDECWTSHRERGFSWLGHRLAQHVDAAPPAESRGLSVCAVRIRTGVVEKVQASQDVVERTLAALNASAVGSSLLYSPDEQRIESVLAQAVHAETMAFRADQLADFAILQLCSAERHADALADAVGGEVAGCNHPIRGARLDADEMLGAPEHLMIPAGQMPSKFAGAEEMMAVAELVRDSPFASFGGSDDGICVEVPFGPGETTLVELLPAHAHPWLGNGLSVRTTSRVSGDLKTVCGYAASTARLQLGTVNGGAQVGAWAIRMIGDSPCLAWFRFVPNFMYREGLTLDVAINEINRALWLDGLLFPDLPSRNAWQAIAQRDFDLGYSRASSRERNEPT